MAQEQWLHPVPLNPYPVTPCWQQPGLSIPSSFLAAVTES